MPWPESSHVSPSSEAIADRIATVQAPVMKRFAWLLIATACQSGDRSAPPPPPATAGSGIARPFVTDAYRKDIDSLCNVVHLSGADEQPQEARQAMIAMWLGPHITTEDGHKYLIAIQPLQGEAKANELEAEARRVGLSGCPLAAEWRPKQ
jgi:hypothetical protein